jgi:hypothetical protein
MFPSNGLEMCRALIVREDRPNLFEFEEFCELVNEAELIAQNWINDRQLYLKLLNKKNRTTMEQTQLNELQNMTWKVQMDDVVTNITDNKYCQRMLLASKRISANEYELDQKKVSHFRSHFI